MNKTILIIIVVLVVVVGGYFFLRSGYQAPVPTPILSTATPSPEGEVPSPEVSPAEVRELTVSGTEYSFDPPSITVSAGDQARITFKNTGRIAHNFVVRDLNISTKTIGSGQTDTVEFTAPASGTYTFICSVPGHRSSGMEGSLKIE